MQVATKQQAQKILSSNPFNVSVLALSSATVVLIGMLIFATWDGQTKEKVSTIETRSNQSAFILNEDTKACLTSGGGTSCGSQAYHYQLYVSRMEQARQVELERQKAQSISNKWDSAIAECDSANIYWMNGEYYGCGLGY